jgi:cation diffusion facilitator CzcD-associated flavoprotein CzcO
MAEKARKKYTGKVVVIGAGVAGCAAAGALQDYGIDFVVYEQADGPGGLWKNNYPGATGKTMENPIS